MHYLQQSDSSDDCLTFVNRIISHAMAHSLRLQPLSKRLNISENAFEDVGQSEPLTVRLKNILRDYKDGLTIIKELLQNCDDAGATEMNICYDTRQHTQDNCSLFFPGLSQCHGPALVVHNNAQFTEDDFRNITKLAGATKEGQPLKIGKFGVGFCSVYHITDIPSFVSDNQLFIFDPTMTYLKGEIKDQSRPGKKVNFTSQLIRRSKQLDPYNNLFNFDSSKRYKGTMFRFPFRTAASELSNNMYTTEDVNQLFEEIKHFSSKLLLFMNNVKDINVYQIDNGDSEPKELLNICRRLTPYEKHSICQVKCNELTEYWLMHTVQDTVLQRVSTASVACHLQQLSEGSSEHFRVEAVEGEVFCFLPLSMKTGLPVHVSSNFAVINNRRGIWTSDDESKDTDEVKWNESLMKFTIQKAYLGLLKTLKILSTSGSIKDYEYFCLWPVRDSLMMHNPWELLINQFYSEITNLELFYSNVSNSWQNLACSKFLDKGILQASNSNDAYSFKCVNDVARCFKLPIVHLPDRYSSDINLGKSTVTEKAFLKCFFRNIAKLESFIHIRNAVLCLALECFANELGKKSERHNIFEEILTQFPCVACAPNGVLLKKCSEIIDPNAKFSKLFDVEDNVFPLNDLCSKPLIYLSVKTLGMMCESIPMKLLLNRANSIPVLFEKDTLLAMERVKLIIECLHNTSDNLKEDGSEEIASIPFLPVLPKPSNYPIPWFGDGQHLACGKELVAKGTVVHGDKTNVFIAGSKVQFVNDAEPEDGGCGKLDTIMKNILHIQLHPMVEDVFHHFYSLIQEFESGNIRCDNLIEMTDLISKNVYAYLDKQLFNPKPSVDLKLIDTMPCIWTGRNFVKRECIAHDWSLKNGPYLLKVPETIVTKKNLLKVLRLKKKFLFNDFQKALSFVSQKHQQEKLPSEYKELVETILTNLATTEIPDPIPPIMLPDTSFVLHKASELAYNDAPWMTNVKGYIYVHDHLPRILAQRLGVKMIRDKRLDVYRKSDGKFKGIPFGQHESLTSRIQNILRDYPFDVTILKELLQNADDSKASRMYIILDERTHGQSQVISENWNELQGPALLVWNDKEFTEEDLEGIQKLGVGSKRSEADSIGQYGIGFNAVYHLTDCPSFITGGKTLCILDPHCKYAPQASKSSPGERYDAISDGFWSDFPDMQSAYLQSDSKSSYPQELSSGTLFRFPLRHCPDLVENSEILTPETKDSSGLLSSHKMNKYLEEWAEEIKQSMFFLNHIMEIMFFIISENSANLTVKRHFIVKLDAHSNCCRDQLHENITRFSEPRGSKPFLTHYQIILEDHSPLTFHKQRKPQKWLVQQGIGDIDEPNEEWCLMKKVKIKPRHGIAAPLQNPSRINGQVFCFLPLPIKSWLPVHINGHFILTSNRRNLWTPTQNNATDQKHQWNQKVLKALASSYAHLLVILKSELLKDITAELKWIESYYDIFPRWIFPSIQNNRHSSMEFQGFLASPLPHSSYATAEMHTQTFTLTQREEQIVSHNVPYNEWLQLAKDVFVKLAQHNSPILAVRKPLHDSITHQPQQTQGILWMPLLNDETPKLQVYFSGSMSDANLKLILGSIGMKITCAGRWIISQFSEVFRTIPTLSPKYVFDYYTKYHSQIFKEAEFRRDLCHISKTSFNSPKNFKKFTKYILVKQEGLLDFHKFPGSPCGVPLLLTADCNLRCFQDDNHSKVIMSQYSKLFPDCSQWFLHPDLIDMSYDPSYFLQSGSEGDRSFCHHKIESLFESRLPAIMKTSKLDNVPISMSFLKDLWLCLTQCAFFKPCLSYVLSEWALLLSCNNKLYSCSSQESIIPILQLFTDSEKLLSDLLQDFKIPFLQTNLIPTFELLEICPTFSNPISILRAVYHFHSMYNLSSDMTEPRAKILVDYFKKIHLMKEKECLKQIKSLPLFLTIQGGVTSLEGKTVYLWPDKLCRNGINTWLTDPTVVFLDRNGAWSSFSLDQDLEIKGIFELEIYTNIIFKQFHLMREVERYEHLQHIRDVWYEQALLNSKNENNTTFEVSNKFVNNLKSLKCIGSDGEDLQSIGQMYDHEHIIFATFSEEFTFLPKFFWKVERINNSDSKKENQEHYSRWKEFLTEFGLHCSISEKEYLKLCHDVADGKHAKNLRDKSKALRDFLFQSKEGQYWFSRQFKSFRLNVASIPFVCAEQYPELELIIPSVKLKTIFSEGESVILTSFRDSCVAKHREIIWSVKPIINPNCGNDTDLQKLSVQSPPQVGDVIRHLVNVSKEAFALPRLFDRHATEQHPRKTISIKNVLLQCLNFINKCKDKILRQDIELLKETPCIPVPSTRDQSAHSVLVLPHHVLIDIDTKKYHPYLHTLPEELSGCIELLKMLGVEHSFHLHHLHTVLRSAHDQLQGQVIDPNTTRVLLNAIQHISEMLSTSSSSLTNDEIIKQLKPLYLPGHDNKLHISKQLIYPDTFNYRKSTLFLNTAAYFQFKPPVPVQVDALKFAMDFCSLLPEDIRPNPMSKVCVQKISSDGNLVKENSDIAEKLRKTMSLTELPKALALILKHVHPTCPGVDLESCFRKIVGNINVFTVSSLEASIVLKENQCTIGTVKVDLLTQSNDHGTIDLYIDSNIATVLCESVYKSLADELLIMINNSVPSLPGSVIANENLREKLCMLLKAQDVNDVKIVFQYLNIAADDSNFGIPVLTPIVGKTIPPELHHLLDQDLQNIFHSQELVAFEISEGHLIYAEVMHLFLADDFNPLEQVLTPMERKYKIRVSVEDDDHEGRIATSLDLYKFLRGPKIDPSTIIAENRDITPYISDTGHVTQPQFQTAKDIKLQLCRELKMIWELSETHKKKALRRLYLKWHPDKNCDDSEKFEEIFKFLLHQIERIENGLEPMLEEEDTPPPPQSHSSMWQHHFSYWKNTARKHRKHHDRYTRQQQSYPSSSSSQTSTNDEDYTNLRKEPEKAQLWLEQAQIDLRALVTLLESAKLDKQLSSHVCFMAHEVAEKALKGGMFAICGLADHYLKTHNIGPLAHALRGERMEVASELPKLTASLEIHYLDTRFPNRYTPPSVPSHHYSLSHAQQAHRNAAKIVEILKQIIL